MSEPALTVASLLRTPALQEACALWLKAGRYALVNLAEGPDLQTTLAASQERVDALLLEQGAIAAQEFQGLREKELLFPAVIIGEVSGREEYHDAEVHLPVDQLEQLSYSLDAAVSRFLRKGMPRGGRQGATGKRKKAGSLPTD